MALKLALKTVKFLSPSPEKRFPRFVTIGFSHFCEKARWGLDLSPLEFYEDIHCPAMHLSTTLMELSSLPRVTTWTEESEFHASVKTRAEEKITKRKEKSAVPKLVFPKSYISEFGLGNIAADHGVVESGASGILKFLSDVYPAQLGHLYPTGDLGSKVLVFEAYLEKELATAASDWSFGNLLLTGAQFTSDQSVVSPSATATTAAVADGLNFGTVDFFLNRATSTDVPLVEKLMLRLLGKKFLLPLMIKANGVSSSARESARSRISRIYEFTDSLVRQKTPGKFLFNSDHITAADITLAAMSLPVLMPPQIDPLFTSLEKLEQFLSEQGNDNFNSKSSKRLQGLQEMVFMARNIRSQHVSAQYALDLYANHRFSTDSLSIAAATASGARVVKLRTREELTRSK